MSSGESNSISAPGPTSPGAAPAKEAGTLNSASTIVWEEWAEGAFTSIIAALPSALSSQIQCWRRGGEYLTILRADLVTGAAADAGAGIGQGHNLALEFVIVIAVRIDVDELAFVG